MRERVLLLAAFAGSVRRDRLVPLGFFLPAVPARPLHARSVRGGIGVCSNTYIYHVLLCIHAYIYYLSAAVLLKKDALGLLFSFFSRIVYVSCFFSFSSILSPFSSVCPPEVLIGILYTSTFVRISMC